MVKTYTIATLGDIVIATVPDGGDIYAAVAASAARADVDIDFRDIDVTGGVTIAACDPDTILSMLDECDGLAPFKCTYCGQPSWIDPADQAPPPDYCQDIDHGTGESGNDERDALDQKS